MKGSTSSSGMGVTGVLGIVFVVLKLAGVIAWSWWWVTAPYWVPILIYAMIVTFAAWLKA